MSLSTSDSHKGRPYITNEVAARFAPKAHPPLARHRTFVGYVIPCLTRNSWIPAFAGMTDASDAEASAVSPSMNSGAEPVRSLSRTDRTLQLRHSVSYGVQRLCRWGISH